MAERSGQQRFWLRRVGGTRDSSRKGQWVVVLREKQADKGTAT